MKCKYCKCIVRKGYWEGKLVLLDNSRGYQEQGRIFAPHTCSLSKEDVIRPYD